MADNEKEPKLEELPIDKQFESIVQWIQKEKEQSQKTNSSQNWIFAVIAAILVFIILAITAFSAWIKGKEVAKMLHNLDLEKEKKIQNEINQKVTVETEKQKVLENEAKEISDKIDSIKIQMNNREKERISLCNKIDSITSWEQFDKL